MIERGSARYALPPLPRRAPPFRPKRPASGPLQDHAKRAENKGVREIRDKLFHRGFLLRDIDLDHVGRAGDVHGGTSGDHEAVAGFDDATGTGGIESTHPEVGDVVCLGDL